MLLTENPLAQSRQLRMARIGRAFEAYRLSRNIRQEDLADMAGIARSTLARLERDGAATLDTTLRVLDALGLGGRIDLLIPEIRQSPLDLISGSRQRATGAPELSGGRGGAGAGSVRRRIKAAKPQPAGGEGPAGAQSRRPKWGDER